MENTRRRGAALEADLLDAAWTELQAVGYARLTMEGVAARARTGKQVLYRRWANRAELVVAALRHRQGGSMADQVPDTGSLREDVLAVLRQMAERQRDIGQDVVHGVLAEIGEPRVEVFEIMREVMTTVLERAAARGEIPTADVPPRIMTLPTDLVRNEIVMRSEPLTEATLTEIVDEIFLPLVRRG
ncbi:TetR/AcrR family transcriptional regulator [Streptomyces justiciae]|uniref:TetR/AcrR family transcriptional regulator n=1 Tax=Streptomyces justiciae TaxID=2780140 RepID=UPI00187DE8B3|nr:TetR/AcrR family transcriptional regulator [Streptomyces justiciae]MBE8472657.1 TetR/AcrR family transcriptional regulator [Streptomyces justiciae]